MRREAKLNMCIYYGNVIYTDIASVFERQVCESICMTIVSTLSMPYTTKTGTSHWYRASHYATKKSLLTHQSSFRLLNRS
jgi:hypothetical protein